jgi:hypothetical protein
VDKVAQSKQLRSITDPELLVLFEDWFEEMEAEQIDRGKRPPGPGAQPFSPRRTVSRVGAQT